MREPKAISLALQGGGAHGAFTWGVLARLLEEPALKIEGICGTSAGAMNAALLAYGLNTGDQDKTRELLDTYWRKISELARFSLLQPTPLDKLLSPGNMDCSPFYQFFDALSRVASPYQLNPLNRNPLRDLLSDLIDFDRLRQTHGVNLFICATNVLTGKIRVFNLPEVSVDVLCASACLPFLFQAVTIDGQPYWDGGYMGNPPLFPLIYHTPCPDILIIQVNPISIPKVPTTAQAIADRINEISFNSSLMREMRAIHFVSKLIDSGYDHGGRLRRLYIHTIGAEEVTGELGVSSKLNADWEFLCYLRKIGYERAEEWIEKHYDRIGKTSSCDIETVFL